MNDLESRLRTVHPTGTDALVAAALRRAHDHGAVDVAVTTHDSPVGPLQVAVSDAGLLAIGFSDHDVAAEIAHRLTPRVVELTTPAADEARRELDEYFAGRRRDFDLALDWSLSKGFRRVALQRLVEVPFGHTVSYGELAERAGNPKAARAVGSAMATNPIPIVVPCHRVLRTGGGLGGYGGGLDAKRLLLTLEGVVV